MGQDDDRGEGGSLGERLVERLRRGAQGEVVAERAGVRARASVRGSGLYGSEIEELSVERAAPAEDADGARTRRVTEKVAERLDYLGEPLEAQEIAPALGHGRVRTRRDRVRGREFFELDVARGGSVRVTRVRAGSGPGERAVVPQNHGHGTLRRLVDDLGELVGEGDDDAG